MNAKQAQEAFSAFEDEAGPRARVIVTLSSGHYHPNVKALACGVYLGGFGQSEVDFRATGDSWEELLADARALLVEFQGKQRPQFIRKMALDIIRTTAEYDHCAPAHLYALGYTEMEVADYADAACADADNIAGRGPFRVYAFSGDNGPEGDDE